MSKAPNSFSIRRVHHYLWCFLDMFLPSDDFDQTLYRLGHEFSSRRYAFPEISDRNGREYKYFMEKVIPHKLEVLRAGLNFKTDEELMTSLGIDTEQLYDRLLFHDLSKLSDKEIAYAYYDFGGENASDEKWNFEWAWHHHKQQNDHHPEYWLHVNRTGSTDAYPMPPIAVVEMVADWIGAGRVYGGSLQNK